MTNLTLEFVPELPESKLAGEREVEDILTQLKARPGVWALVRRDTYDSFHRRFPGAQFFKIAKGDGRYDTYLRWPAHEDQPLRELRWEDPPHFQANQVESREETDAIVEQLKRRPGQWAIVEQWEGSSNTSRRVKWRERGAEVRVRTRGNMASLYARWPKDA